MSAVTPRRRHLMPVCSVAAVLLALVLSTLATGSGSSAATGPEARREAGCRLSATLVPRCPGALSGAYVAPRPGETATATLSRFERETRARTQVVHHYYRGDQLFPSEDQADALRSGPGRRILFANWKPEDGYTWREVADGAADARLRRQAAYLQRVWPHRMFLGVHHEPEDEIVPRAGSGYAARAYRAMYRHVVDVFRAEGAHKVVWVMNYMGAQKWALTDWYDRLWPGADYVDWIAFDPYKTAGIGGQEGEFDSLVNQYWGETEWRGAYDWAQTHHPRKPVMLAEWGVGERPDAPTWKGDFFRGIPGHLPRFPRLKALVYFDNDDADVAGNVSVDTSRRSLAGFRDYLDSGALARFG